MFEAVTRGDVRGRRSLPAEGQRSVKTFDLHTLAIARRRVDWSRLPTAMVAPGGIVTRRGSLTAWREQTEVFACFLVMSK